MIVLAWMHFMRAVVQRVSEAVVEFAAGRAAMGRGLLVYLGVGRDDTPADVDILVDKVRHLRIFEDEAGKLNLDVAQAGGAVMAISAFTVQADARRGRRPSFELAAAPEEARKLYESFCAELAATGLVVERGSFGNHMRVHGVNDGPICVLLDSRKVF